MSFLKNTTTGFSLVELIVSIALFVTVVAIASTTTLSVLVANRTIVEQQELSDNVSIFMDGLARSLRSGTSYFCSTSSNPSTQSDDISNGDCETPGKTIAFEDKFGDRSDPNDQIVYYYGILSGPLYDNDQTLYQSSDSGDNYTRVFSKEISVDQFAVLVDGSTLATSGDSNADITQPMATVFLQVSDRNNDESKPQSYQITVTQRLLDYEV